MVLGSSESDEDDADATDAAEADDEAMSSPNLTDTEVGHTSSPSGTEGAVSSPPLPTSPESVLPPVADDNQSQEREGTAERPTVATMEMDDNNQEE